MEYRQLGTSGIEVSVMALGCWPFAGGSTWGDQDDDVSITTVHAALDAGITFFDTAEGYGEGHSERVLGEGLKGRRHEAIIATKVSSGNLSPAKIPDACEQSLKNLQTDVIDLYQIHWPNHEVPIEESWHALENLKTQGKVRALGVCNFAVQDMGDLLPYGHCETDQLPYNMLWRPIEHEIQPLCVENDVGLICYSSLAQGLLTGRYNTADDVPEGLSRSRLFSSDRPLAKHGEEGCEQLVFEAIQRVREVAEGLGHSMAAVAFAWVAQQAGVTSLLVGSRSPDELALNLPSLDVHLDDDVVATLNEATQPVRDHLGTSADMWVTPSRMR